MKVRTASLIGSIVWLAYCCTVDSPNVQQSTEAKEVLNVLNMPWISNKGQKHPDILYHTNTFLGEIGITKSHEIVYSISRKGKRPILLKEAFLNQLEPGRTQVLQTQPSKIKANFFKGDDPENWQRETNTFERIKLRQVWRGIDVSLKAYHNNVEKEFTVQPHISVDDIKMVVEGVEYGFVNINGELEVETANGQFSFTPPIAWQWIDGEKVDVDVEYTVTQASNTLYYGFKVGSYDPNYSLSIDPLISSTYFGGSFDDYALDLARDQLGNVFLTGLTYSSDFPLGDQHYQGEYSSIDLFIVKISSDLSTLLAATFVGGSKADSGRSIQLDEEGNVYVVGSSESPDFPVTENAYDRSLNGVVEANTADVIVLKMSSDLSTLLNSTYLGGINDDNPRQIILDSENQVYIVGRSRSIDFPMAGTPYDDELIWNNRFKVFLAKMTDDLSTLLASTYLGGNGMDDSDAMVLDQQGNIFVVGNTFSEDFPIVGAAIDSFFDNTFSSRTDGFVAKFDTSLSQLLASTYLGGTGSEEIKGIVVDQSGNPVIGGYTYSATYPTTIHAYRDSFEANNEEEMVITKLSPSLDSLIASTFFGGTEEDRLLDIAIDIVGNIYLSGVSDSPDFPVTSNAISTSSAGRDDIVLAVFDSELTSLKSSSYFGGRADDVPLDLEVDSAGHIWMTGQTLSENYPVTEQSFNQEKTGKRDAIISNIYMPIAPSCTALLYPEPTGNYPASTLELKWHQIPYAAGYKLSISSYSGMLSEQTDLDLGNQTTFSLTNIPENDSIFVRIDAYNELGTSMGCQTYFFTTDLINSTGQVAELQRLIGVSPNPAEDQVRIQFIGTSLGPEGAHLELFDMEGRLRMERHYFSSENEVYLDLSTLEQGAYLLRVRAEEGYQVKKILKF